LGQIGKKSGEKGKPPASVLEAITQEEKQVPVWGHLSAGRNLACHEPENIVLFYYKWILTVTYYTLKGLKRNACCLRA
jgi:hypothetical protein